MTSFGFTYYMIINSWQNTIVFILLLVALLLFLWLYKSGYRIEKQHGSGKVKNQNSEGASKQKDDEKVGEDVSYESSGTSEETSVTKRESDNNSDNKRGFGSDKHLDEIDKYLYEIEEHLAGVIESDGKKNSDLPLGQDDIEVPEDIAELLAAEGEENIKKDRPTILIVDDNLAIRMYLGSILRGSYNVLVEVNGEKGLDIARKEIPDLIISDIVMPVMDGIEFCEEIRNDSSISYLPFIMLTSKIGDQEKLKGLRSGADVYLQKPFNANVLLETVKNTLSSRKKLLDKIHQEEKGIYTLPISSKDSFLKKLDIVINSRIDDHDLKIEDIANELNISVRQFQRKVKELSGYTPKKYLRYRRLKAAEYLLKNDSGTITEVAYAVGFNNLSLFSSYFKAEFNVLPSTLKSTNKGA